MAELDKMPKWLGITGQQYNIVEAIVRLQKKGEIPSPRAIIEDDAYYRKAPRMQKSNFFAQLTSLKGRGIVTKSGEASYAVDFDAIRRSLEAKEDQIEKEGNEIKKARKGAESYFRQASMGEKKPNVAFYDYPTVYGKVAQMLRESCSAYIAGPFPRMLYSNSPCLLRTPEVGNYSRALWDRCIQNRETKLTYLSQFDIEYLFKKLLACYKSPHLAYEEIRMILEGLTNLLDQHPNIHIYYTDSPYPLDMILPDTSDVDEFFLIIRDDQKRGIGGIYINSPELTVKFKNLYEETCTRAIDMRSNEGKTAISHMRQKLEKLLIKYRQKKAP